MAKKAFIYSVKTSRPRSMGGRSETANIYRIKKNKPVLIGEAKWNTAGYKGQDSEIYTKLNKSKLVSDKEFKSNGGYYRRDKSDVSIHEV